MSALCRKTGYEKATIVAVSFAEWVWCSCWGILWIKAVERVVFTLLVMAPEYSGWKWVNHYSDVIMSAMATQSPASRLFPQPFVRALIKQNIKAPRHWPLWGESNGHRWIPLTKGQWRGKCFHLMTSSWSWLLMLILEPAFSGTICQLCRTSLADYHGIFPSWACHSGGHYHNYYYGTPSLCQVSALIWSSGTRRFHLLIFKWVAETGLHDRISGYDHWWLSPAIFPGRQHKPHLHQVLARWQVDKWNMQSLYDFSVNSLCMVVLTNFVMQRRLQTTIIRKWITRFENFWRVIICSNRRGIWRTAMSWTQCQVVHYVTTRGISSWHCFHMFADVHHNPVENEEVLSLKWLSQSLAITTFSNIICTRMNESSVKFVMKFIPRNHLISQAPGGQLFNLNNTLKPEENCRRIQMYFF